jgi:hypothetical protein
MRSSRQILLVGMTLCIFLILYGVWITPGAGVFTLDNIARMAPAFAILGSYALIAILASESMNRRSSLFLSKGKYYGSFNPG